MSFNNMGKTIPGIRKDAAYEMAKGFGVDREAAFGMVNRVAEFLERDKPGEAMDEAQKTVDLCGAYMMLAALLTDPVVRS